MKELFNKLPKWLREYDYKKYLSNNYVVIDFETTIIDHGSPYVKENKIVCSSWKCGPDHADYRGGVTNFHKAGEYNQVELVEAIESADFWVAHNSKFEYGWLERCGLPLEKTLTFCTQIAEFVLLSNRSRMLGLSLNKCLARRNMKGKDDLGGKLLKAGVCPSVWPLRVLKRYSIQDTKSTESLFLHQRAALVAHKQLPVMFTRCIFTPAIVDIEKKGMHLDEGRVTKVTRDYRARLVVLDGKLAKVTGGANPASPKQMREVLYEKLKFKKPKDAKWITSTGEPTTSFDYIGQLKPKNKKQTSFKRLKQEWSQVNAALTKALNKFSLCCEENSDNILTASFNQTIVVTQRLSSTGKKYGAQFQNFPRIFKPLFSARHKGWKIGEIDQAQLEYRVAVWYGQDEAGLHDILEKVDAHAFTALQIFGDKFRNEEENSPLYQSLRTASKAHTFKPLYGGKSGTKDEVRYYKAFTDKHKGVARIQEQWKMDAINTGKVRCASGLIFYFPNTRIKEDGYVTNSTNICNYNVQSFATADIVPIGVTFQWHLMRQAGMKSFITNTVHDSTKTEVHPEEIEQFKEIGTYAHVDIVLEYLDKVYGIDFNVPLEVEIKLADNWADNEHWRKKFL